MKHDMFPTFSIPNVKLPLFDGYPTILHPHEITLGSPGHRWAPLGTAGHWAGCEAVAAARQTRGVAIRVTEQRQERTVHVGFDDGFYGSSLIAELGTGKSLSD